MAEIKTNFGEGGANVAPKASGEPSLAEALRAAVDDITDLRAKLAAVAVLLDAEGALGGGYVTAATPATQKLTKG
jgi:hypothetical protein